MTDENIVNKAYEAIEIASKTGKIKKGTNEVTKAIERGSAKLVLVAGDVNPPEVIMHIEPLCKEKNTPYVKVPNREELGAAANLNIPTSSVAIIEMGDSEIAIKEIVAIQTKEAEPEVKEEPKEEKKEEVKKEKLKEEKKEEVKKEEPKE
ncbi:50S ribosomal protein L7ae [Candidatus Woesearchaeota archaeon]|nr:50S ribosomal protein L7ae [Candidatus Woesearchaeota archaeon]